MPTAKGSEPSESAVSNETAQRRMSSPMSEPMSRMPVGTTKSAQVANASLPVGQRIKKTPIFISGDDTRAFLAWLRASCPCKLTAQLKAEKLVVDPTTANGFRGAVSALPSLNVKSDLSFHTYSLPEDRSVGLLIKTLGKRMTEGVVLEELGSLGFRVQGVMQLRSGRRDQDSAKDLPSTPTSLCVWHEARSCLVCGPSRTSVPSESVWRLA
jgi:hypothetical protein